MQTPDVTKAQGLAVVQAVIAVAIAFGVPLNQTQQVALLALAGALASLLVAADAAIRRARAKHIAGPLADRSTAQAIIAAATPPARTDPIKAATTTLASEAAADEAAAAANEPPDGIDPATLG